MNITHEGTDIIGYYCLLFYYAVIFLQIFVPSRTMNITTHEGTDIIGYYCMCIYIYFVLNKYYYIIIIWWLPC